MRLFFNWRKELIYENCNIRLRHFPSCRFKRTNYIW
nr:MAG TPA: hypothetical protein [Caudoviricetes sp.]